MRKARAIQLNVPVYKKVLLTVEEASDYSGFGVNKVRNLIKEKNANFVVNNGNKHLIMLSNVRLFKDSLVKIIGDIFDSYDSLINLFGGQCQII